ncbi:MAG TPA: hypothetical protein VFY26_23570 [Anaerolineales bacterium]|nr:hypothetical protein [Anaerolineales bacterium]
MSVRRFAREFIMPAVYLAILLGLIVFIVSRDLPKVGHDYGFFLPRLLDTHLHHRVDGLGIQWYTANFGAGTPAYPNPQYIQYSLPQFLLFVVNPWTALMLSLVAYSVIGYTGFYLFLREEMGLIASASALGASFILANGFFVEHALVGHVGFQHFPLLGAVLFLLFSKRLGFLPSGILIGLLCAAMVNQAGFINLILFGVSLLILLPLIYLLRPDTFRPKVPAALLAGGLSAIMFSLSKVSAVLAFLRNFPRVIEDAYGQTYLQGLLGMVRQLTGFIFIAPNQLLTGQKMEDIAGFFQQGAGAQFGIWEMDIALSPGLLILLLLGLGYLVSRIGKTSLAVPRGKRVAALLLFLAVWLAADLTLAQGWLYSLIKPLPILRSLHANVRFTSGFIFPLAVIGAFVFHEVVKDRKPLIPAAFGILSLSTIAMLTLYLAIPEDVHVRNFNIDSVLSTYAEIDRGWNFRVKNVAEITDMEAFQQENSNLTTQDPMFGYVGEYFEPKAVPGPVMEIRDGAYNMTNPAGFVFPAENGFRPFDLFQEDQKEELDAFLNHRQPDLGISVWQKTANIISGIMLIISLVYLTYEGWKGISSTRHAFTTQDYAHEKRVI